MIRTEDTPPENEVVDAIRRVFRAGEATAISAEDLRASGLLYFINKHALHEFGFGLELGEDGAFRIVGSGREPIAYDRATHRRRAPDVPAVLAVLAARHLDIERLLERRRYHPFRRAENL